MALLYVDSFDGYTTSEIPNYWSDQAISASASLTNNSRTGPNAMQPRPGGVARSLGSNIARCIIGAAFLPNAQSVDIFQFTQSGPTGTVQVKLSVGANGAIVIHPASGPAAVANVSQLIQANVYNYIEWLTGFTHASANEVRVNGQSVISIGLDCQATFLPGADTFFLLGAGGGNANIFDDLYVLNPDGGGLATFLGDSSVICGIPSSDGSYTQWGMHPVVAAHYINVREIPADFNASYNASTGANARDTYNVLPALATDKVIAAQLTELVADIDGDGLQAHSFITVQGADFPGTHDYTASTYIPPQLAIYEFNPATGLAWTPAQLNGTSWGIQQV
jgi:hypothetical protein